MWGKKRKFDIRINKKNLRSVYNRLVDVDYYYYTVKVLQNLPEALLIVFLGFLLVFNLLKYTEELNGNKIYTILTGSMKPAITPGSLIFLSPQSQYQKGDIISYTEKTSYGVGTGKVLTHRIIGKTEEGNFITKGDANSDTDPQEVSKSQIQGKVIRVIPNLGYIESFVRTLPGFLLVVAGPTMFLIIRRIKDIKIILKGN